MRYFWICICHQPLETLENLPMGTLNDLMRLFYLNNTPKEKIDRDLEDAEFYDDKNLDEIEMGKMLDLLIQQPNGKKKNERI